MPGCFYAYKMRNSILQLLQFISNGSVRDTGDNWMVIHSMLEVLLKQGPK